MQILKEEIKTAIINSAAELFVSKGIKQSNMRDVAKGANITVGNLYRYFPNKDALIFTIINPALEEINTLILKASNDTVSLNNVHGNANAEEVVKNIKILAYGLLEIYHRHTLAMLIISQDTVSVRKIEDWLSDVFFAFFRNTDLEKEMNIQLLSRMYSVSVIGAVKEAFKKGYDNSDEDLNKIISYYLTMILKGVNNEFYTV